MFCAYDSLADRGIEARQTMKATFRELFLSGIVHLASQRYRFEFAMHYCAQLFIIRLLWTRPQRDPKMFPPRNTASCVQVGIKSTPIV